MCCSGASRGPEHTLQTVIGEKNPSLKRKIKHFSTFIVLGWLVGVFFQDYYNLCLLIQVYFQAFGFNLLFISQGRAGLGGKGVGKLTSISPIPS